MRSVIIVNHGTNTQLDEIVKEIDNKEGTRVTEVYSRSYTSDKGEI